MYLIALGLEGLLFGIGSSEVRRFENAAAQDISSRLSGTDKQVKVRTKLDPIQALGGRMKSATISASGFSTNGLPLFTQPWNPKSGRLGELKINLKDFSLSGLKVLSLEANIPSCRFDFGLAQRRGQIRLTESGVGTGMVRVTQKALQEFALRRLPALQRLNIQLAGDKATIAGSGRFVNFQTDVTIVGRLVSPDGTRVEVADATVEIGGKQATEQMAHFVLQIINPVLDLNRDLHLFGALKIEEIRLEDGLLVATGAARIPNHPVGTWIVSLGLYLP